jgi:hypothetical protein
MSDDTPRAEHEKRCAQIVDQLTPIIMGDTGYVGPEKFKALTLRLAELLCFIEQRDLPEEAK